MGCAQIPLQHFQLLAVFQANNVVGRNGTLDGDRRFGRRFPVRLPAAQVFQGAIDRLDDFCDLGICCGVVADLGTRHLRSHPQEFVTRKAFGGSVRHFVFLSGR